MNCAYANDVRDLSEEEEELGDETGVPGDEGDEERSEEDAQVFQKMIDAVENHDGNISLLYSGAGMYLLGMTSGGPHFGLSTPKKPPSTTKQL